MKPRYVLWLIILLTCGAIIVDIPKIPIKFSLGPLRFDKILVHPSFPQRDLEPKLGLDLKGGAHLVLQADMSEIASENRANALESAKNIVENRVNLFGVSEPVVQTSKVGSDWRIIVELPGVTNVDEAVKLIGETAKLEFWEEKATSAQLSTETASPSSFLDQWQKTDLSGRDLKIAKPGFSPQNGQPEVEIEFAPEGAKKFEEITKRNVGKPVLIMLDNQVISDPRVNEVIAGGKASISGKFTTEETKNLAIQLNAGALPVPIKVIQQENIGPTLGSTSIQKSFIAGAIGLGIVATFMIFSYGILGILADFALLIYTLLVFAIFKALPVTLTLAGIAGFILSIGMAVDANILIFERMKEEIRWGEEKKKALELGFSRAWSSIRDSNISSLITCGILYWFGSGIVRGFAVTLAIGILVSMFSAITITRTFLRLIYRK
jgi:preprotein translocase subunit SecD